MTWLVDGRTFARKVKNPSECLSGNGGSYKSRHINCPACGYLIDENNGVQEWPGLPAGVKFDPSDQELLKHLSAKVVTGASKSHPFIDEFIPILEGEDGICYTHPEKLPGIRRDGTSIHFFHTPAKAYTTGTRKRRKILAEHDEGGCGGEMRWHKTGKTRPVMENGRQFGCKKIMVLYVSSGKKTKPEKTNWIMHQYHLGIQEEEKEGELVVSKVFYQTQPRQSVCGRKGGDENFEEMDPEELAFSFLQSSANAITTSCNSRGTPTTPKIPAPPRPQTGKQNRGLYGSISEDVNKINSSLAANTEDKSWSLEQVTEFYLWQRTTDKGDQDTCTSLGGANPCNKGTHYIAYEADSTLKSASKNDAAKNFHSTAADLSFSLDEMSEDGEMKADSCLENIILDTPPDLLLESFLNSQETLDWLEKRKFGGDSQKSSGCEDFNSVETLHDSQSST